MEHDEKLKSGPDTILPVGHEDHSSSESVSDNAGGKSGMDAGGPKIEANFGMPSFDFFTEPKSESRSEPKTFSARSSSQSSSTSSPRDLPLNDGTGWQSGASIDRQGSVRARAQFPDDDNTSDNGELPEISILQPETQSRPQATVMPFPGTTFPRQSEMPTGSAAILGGRDASEFPDFEAVADDDDADYEGGDQDTLADAVSSALRNVYGARSAESWQDDGEESGVADSLIGTDTRVGDVMWPEDPNSGAAYMEDERESANAEANTEAVLEYLYGNRRMENVETLTLDTALKDIDPDLVGMQPHYEDGDDYDDDRSTGFPLQRERERDPYRGGGRASDHRYAEPAVPLQPAGDWQQPAYMTNLPVRSGPGYVTSAPEPLASSSDSGHLLGAAGLGLIGGIALAGVLAVFVFNSFVDVNDGNMDGVAGGNKTSERLAAVGTSTSGQFDARGSATRSIGSNSASVADAPGSSDGMLSVRGVSGQAGEPIRLSITLANQSRGEDALVSIKGLPKDARLSTGIDVGGGQWLLPPARLKNLTVTVPNGTAGAFNLGAQLLKDDAQTSLSEPVFFTLSIGTTKSAAVQQPAMNDASPSVGKRPAAPEDAAQAETDFLTQMLIRDGNKAMREGDITAARRLYEQAAANGSPEAALAMGRSYDPTYFERLNVKNGKPDPATAFEWYKRALDGGLSTARIKIDALKLWLQK